MGVIAEEEVIEEVVAEEEEQGEAAMLKARSQRKRTYST